MAPSSFLSFVLCFISITAQAQMLHGKIIDAATQQPLVYANIGVIGKISEPFPTRMETSPLTSQRLLRNQKSEFLLLAIAPKSDHY